MKTKTSANVQAVRAGTRMLAVKDEQGVVMREFPASTWEPAGGFFRPEVQSTEVVFAADVEGDATQITWKNIASQEEKARRTTVAKHPHADPATLFYSAQAQKYGVLIRCVESGEVRRVWTSDLHQVNRSEKVQALFRREQQKQKRADKKADKI